MEDFYRTLMRKAYDIPEGTFTREQKEKAKYLLLPSMYGSAHISEEDMIKLLRVFKNLVL